MRPIYIDPRKWCRDQLRYFKEIPLYPEDKALDDGMEDYVNKIMSEVAIMSYIDNWSWVMRNSELLPGGYLNPKEKIDLSPFSWDVEKLWAWEYLKRWDKYLCSDGVIRMSHYHERYDEVTDQIKSVEDEIIADRAADGFILDIECSYDETSRDFVNPETGERKGWFD